MKRTYVLAVLAMLLAVPARQCLAEEPGRDYAAETQAMVTETGLREAPDAVRDFPGWRQPGKVLVRLLRPDWLAPLQAVAPGVEIVAVETAAEAAAASGDADALIGYCDESILSQAPRLRWVQVYSAGVDRCVGNPGLKEGGKILTNGQRLASPALAEHAVALMLALARGLDLYQANQAQSRWERDVGMKRADFIELEGRTMLVIGLGGIGGQVAKRGHGLGMRVIATRGSRREGPDYVDYVGLADEAQELARQADVVINTAPLTERTRGMFDRAFFQAMKPSAYFVSVGRGGSTVTDDLLAALQNGELRGAGLDVTDPEPLPPGHPLWHTPRVIITPHVAGASDRGLDRLLLLVRENLRRYVAGDPLYSVVDIARGY